MIRRYVRHLVTEWRHAIWHARHHRGPLCCPYVRPKCSNCYPR